VLTANARLTMGHPYMRAGVEWAALRSNGNHILSIQTAHMLDIASQCLGDFRDVSAQITTMYTRWAIPDSPEAIEADVPDCVMVRATTQSGAILSAHFAYIPNHGNGWRLEIYGDQGVLVASSPGPAMVLPNRIEGPERETGTCRSSPCQRTSLPCQRTTRGTAHFTSPTCTGAWRRLSGTNPLPSQTSIRP
jgi:predicted dehydrogenase